MWATVPVGLPKEVHLVEAVIGGFLFPDVRPDYLLIPTYGRHEVAAGPQMPTPIRLLQMLELHQQLPRAFAFDVLHDLAR